MSRTKASVEDFVRVTVKDRAKFDTHEKAASELGLKLSSFRQRLTKTRNLYPKVYEGVPRYTSTKTHTEEEVLQMLADMSKPAAKK